MTQPTTARQFDPVAKLTSMQQINNAIIQTPIATAKVWNLWPTCCEPGLNTLLIKGTPDLTAAPVTIPEDATFAGLKFPAKTSFLARYRQLRQSNDVMLSAETFEDARLVMKTDYLNWGRTNWRSIKGGNCTYFAGVTIGWLSDNIGLVPAGATVEQFDMTESGQGHAFVVVDRDPASTPGNPATWGLWCFVVDMWYARQRLTAPGTSPAKDLNDPTSVLYLANFVQFLGGGTITRGPAYSYEQLTSLR